jgi:Ser/Thr protein kinase RdoA (MazF antagonist)
MDWLSALGRDTNLSVPHPLAARDGSMVVEASAEGVPEARLCEIFSWVPGVDLADRFTLENVQRLGELSARLHQHARSYQPPRKLQLLKYDRVFPFQDPIVLFDQKYAALVSSELKQLCEQAMQWVQTAIDGLKKCGEPMRIIHGDLHQWNVRIARGVLSPIDFEDLMWGWPVQDIATTLYYSQTAPDFVEKRVAFQEGYCRVQPWPERTPGEIDAFLAARGLGMFNFALQAKELPDLDMKAFAERLKRRLSGLMVGHQSGQ